MSNRLNGVVYDQNTQSSRCRLAKGSLDLLKTQRNLGLSRKKNVDHNKPGALEGEFNDTEET